ncbi:MAG: transcription elongation factor GreAB [Verrucomicrobiales bacterium]
MSFKNELLDLIRKEMREQLARLTAAAKDAHAAATDPDAQAEGKYDTRSLEASYLASGQARQLEELTESLRVLESFTPREYGLEEAIDAGALVETSLDDEVTWFLLAPSAGGHSRQHDDRDVTLLTPSSRLYQALLGKSVGTIVEETGHFITEIE